MILLLCTASCLTPGAMWAQDREAAPEQLVMQADRLLAQGQVDAAQDAYRRALALDDGLVTAYLGLGRVDLEERQWGGAIDRFDEVLARTPDDLDAHYYRGIAHRELAKFRTFNQTRHWRGAEDDFEWCIQRDSLYRDVLYQYALLRHYQEDYPEAVTWGDTQVRLRPDLVEARHGLFRLYRSYLNHTELKEALAWLRARETPHAAYFGGEALRRMGRLDEADTVFEGLLARPPAIAAQPVLLSRARIYYQKGQPERAQAFVEQAIEQIDHPLDAALVFDDFKHIIGEEELALYRTLHTPAAFKAFFDGFWARRNPIPSRPINVRLAEHYRRLLVAERDYAYDGFRLWFSDPDRRGDLAFPAAYTLNQEFNDKGLIYLRHGEPDDRQGQVGGHMEFRSVIDNTDVYGMPSEYAYDAGWRPNESWRYYRPRQMDFHFVVDEGGGANNWRLAPELTHFGMLENREHWGPPYAEMTRAVRIMESIKGSKIVNAAPGDAVVRSLDEELSEEEIRRLDSLNARRLDLNMVAEQNRNMLEFHALRRRMVEQSREAVTLALTTDQHTDWAEDVALLPMPYMPAAFRGPDGRTRVEIYYALPIGTITEAMGGGGGTVDVEMGFAVHDTAWQAVAEDVRTKRVPTHPDPTAALIDFYQFTVPPDSYSVSIHGFAPRTNQLGGDAFGYRARDFSKPGLAMSDLLLADYIGPAQMSRFDRGELHVSPNPFGRFSTRQPVFVYFELYRLMVDARDQTQFTVEYTLTPQQPKGKILGLFGGTDRPSLSLSMDRTGADPSPVEHTEIDVRDVDPGAYTLTVKVTDRLTGEVREQSRPLELFKYE